MIFGGVLAGAFLYFAIVILKIGLLASFYFTGVAAITLIFHKNSHFKTAQITLIFLYLISLLLWSKGGSSLAPQFVYLLGTAALFFVLSDLFFRLFFKILSWSIVGISVALVMYERFGSLPVAIIVGMIVIPIAIRDRKHVRNDQN